MGLWNIISGHHKAIYDRYAWNAHETVERVRKDMRRKYGDNPDIVRPKEAEELKSCIKRINEQGGLGTHKYALARWQIFKALYPEWITDADRPEFIPEAWKDL